jgi:anti-sigma-K factor RskA
MSGPAPRENGEDYGVDVLAGEYVLGLLDTAAARAVEQRARIDPAMAAAIAAWQDRFEPLADLVAPLPPDEATWPRIAAGLHAVTVAHISPPVSLGPLPTAGPSGSWRAAALASMALAACLAAFIAWPRRMTPEAGPWARAMALLSAPGSATASLRVQVTRAGMITVVPLQHLEVAADRRLGFWAWPAGEKAPVLLGLISPDGGQLPYPFAPREGTPVMVTLEKPDVRPGAAPGPTLYLGLLVAGS